MSTKTNYIGYKLITNIKKGDLLGYFLPSKISDLAYSIETLASIGPETNMMYLAWNSVVEHICFVPLTEMYFLCCTQQLASIKGQLVSPFGVIVWTKIPTKVFKDFCPSLLKEVEQKKMKRLYFF